MALPTLTQKVSALTNASLPLAGTETIHLISGGSNQKTTVDNVVDRVQAVNESEKAYSHIYMISNATSTTISVAGTYTKIVGTTSINTNQNFTNSTSNKSIYTGTNTKDFVATGLLSLTGGNNKDIAIKLAKNGTVLDHTLQQITTDGGGKFTNLTLKDLLIDLATNDYLEVFITNLTDTTAVTVEDLTFIITPL
jgi:hypothetical protein